MHIDWSSSESEILLNPRLTDDTQAKVRTMLHEHRHLHGHIWVSTSGTTSTAKWAALSKQAILASAEAVNKHLKINSIDRWLHPLPDYHVGGLGIWARSYLSESPVVDYKEEYDKWDAQSFHELILNSDATLTALVPAQVHDLIVNELESPPSLRAVVVGGGALDETLYHKAINLGWKILPSYGLTECSSQVATAALDSCENGSFPALSILSHLEVTINDEGLICIKGPSLLTGYVVNGPSGTQFIDPKQDGWFRTEDLGALEANSLQVLGRSGNMIKIGGENVDLAALERTIDNLKLDLKIQGDLALVAVPDSRLGHVIHLASTIPVEQISSLIERFHATQLPFSRIRQVHVLPSIPRTSLHKLCRNELLKLIASKMQAQRGCEKIAETAS